MADNYARMTIQPNIPLQDITDMELWLLSYAGIQSEGSAELYLFAEEYQGDILIDEFFVPSEQEISDLVEWSKDARNESYFTDGTLDTAISDIEVFQNILHRSETLKSFQLEGAYICSKMRPGEFGGFAWFITKDDCVNISTGSWLSSQEFALNNNSDKELIAQITTLTNRINNLEVTPEIASALRELALACHSVTGGSHA